MKRPLIRIWHPWWLWECFKAGFFGPYPKGMNQQQGEKLCKDFFLTEGLFEDSLKKVLSEWKYSCEHNLTCHSLNKIAWGGQAACCYLLGVPSSCRAGYNLLPKDVQLKMDTISEVLIRQWYEDNNYEQPEKLCKK